MLSAGTQKIIAIAASTGGVEALTHVLSCLPPTVPPVLIVQHMPVGFTNLFAARLDKKLPLSVKEAQTGDILIRGQVLVAPAGKHMKVVNHLGKLSVECFLGPKVQSVIPSADVLFESVANIIRKNAIGVILTGMGADGADGLMMMKQQGAKTVGQDRESSTIYGMPKMAYDRGAIDYQLPLNQIANKIMSLV